MKLLKGENITEIINEITNPVVKRSVSQTVKSHQCDYFKIRESTGGKY